MKANLLEPAIGEVRISERRFGVIAIVVSMFLLGTLLISYIALTISPVKDTAINTTITAATQIVNELMKAMIAQLI